MSLRKRFPLESYSGDGIETINPTLGRVLDLGINPYYKNGGS